MRTRPALLLAGSAAAALVAASTALALNDPEPISIAPVAAATDDDPSLDDLGVTGGDDTPSADDSPSTDDSPSDEASASEGDSASSDAAVTGTETYTVSDAGTVTVGATSSGLEIVRTDPASGWTVEVEQPGGREVEATFRSGAARVDFKAEIEDGGVEIRVRDRRAEEREDEAEEDRDDHDDEDRSGHRDGDDDRDEDDEDDEDDRKDD